MVGIFVFSYVKERRGFAQVLSDELTIFGQPSIEWGTFLKPDILEMKVRQSAGVHPYASPPTPRPPPQADNCSDASASTSWQ
jgi:hypothetical protein